MKNKNDTETENKLKNDHWEIFPEYQRNKLWKYISKLRSDYDRINRYIHAESKDHLNKKLKELELKLKYPYYYRIKNALELIEHFFDKNSYKKIESEKLSECDKYLQNIKNVFSIEEKKVDYEAEYQAQYESMLEKLLFDNNLK